MGFTIKGREVITDELTLEIQSLSDGLPGQQTVSFGGSNSQDLQSTTAYQSGDLKINSHGCKNASGAMGQGTATIKPTQLAASDGRRKFLLDGDRAMCQGQLNGSPSQKPGPCRCVVIAHAKGTPYNTPTASPTKPLRSESVEIVALAYAPQERAWLAFTRDELESMVQENQRLERLVDLAHWSDEQCKADLKKSAVDQLEKLVLNPDKTKGSEISELLWSNGRKGTFVRSEKVRSHLRKYVLNDRAEKHGDLRDLKKLQKLKKKIAQTFTKKEGRTKAIWSVPEADQALFDDYRHPLEILRGDNYQIGGEIAFFRLVMNGSVGSSTVDFKERKLKLAAEGSLTGSLIDGSLQGELFFPNVAGWHWTYDFDHQQYDFGFMRCKLKVKASGYVGVSLMLSGELSMNAKSPELSGGISGEAFAGISGSVEGDLSLEWKPPGLDQKFQLLAAVGAEANVAFGVGGLAEVTFGLSGKKILVRVKAKVVLGLGGGGGVYFTVDPTQLQALLHCVGLNLWRLNFHYLDVITPEAFEYISSLWAYAIAFGDEIGDALLNKADTVVAWWSNEQKGQVDAEGMALRILANPTAHVMAVPEAKGRILRILTQPLWFSREELQEEATLVFLKQSVRTLREFEKTCECMTLHGGERITAMEGRQMLHDLFDLKDQLDFDRWIESLPESSESL